MSIDFNMLRQRSGSNFAALQQSLEKTEKKSYQKDERIWKYAKGTDGKSSSIIRFLSISKADYEKVQAGEFRTEDLTPMIKMIRHSFKGPKGSWYVENSLQTFGEPCAVREHDGPLWKVAKDANDKGMIDILRERLPKTEYFAQILVIKDSVHPENNGKVKIFQFGETIRKLIDKAGKPEFETETPFDPFDFWEGADLLLNLTYEKRKIGKRDDVDVPVWDAVKWAAPSPLFGGDESKIKEIWENQYSLLELIDRKNFKTYEELKAKFAKVMGLDENMNPEGNGASLGKSAESFINETPSAPEPTVKAAPEPVAAPTAAPVDVAASKLDEFRKLLEKG